MNNFAKLTHWSHNNYQNLPWRKNRSLYTTLVSEIMLQQTTVSTVLNHYPQFIKKFPNFKSLAQANEQDLAQMWVGLGYYRRAKNLYNASQTILKEYQAALPNDYDELIKIKGIGEYTANAIIAIGHNSKALALDGNLKRVLSRFFKLSQKNEQELKKAIYDLLNDQSLCKNIDKIGWRAFNESLMDVGREICQAKKVNCPKCPINHSCQTKNIRPLTYPKIEKIKKPMITLNLLRCIHQKKDGILCYRKQANQWLTNQWELPTFNLTKLDNFHQYPAYGKKNIDKKELLYIKTFITKYKITNYLTKEKPPKSWYQKNPSYKYISFKEIEKKKFILSTASIKSLEKLNYL